MYEVPSVPDRSSSSWLAHILLGSGLFCQALSLWFPWSVNVVDFSRFPPPPPVTLRGYETLPGRLLLIWMGILLSVWVVAHAGHPWGLRVLHRLSLPCVLIPALSIAGLALHLNAQYTPILPILVGTTLISSAIGRRLRQPH